MKSRGGCRGCRTRSGEPAVSGGDVTLLRVIKAAQRLGFTLEEIADLLDLSRRHSRQPPGLAVRAKRKLSEVEAHIADLPLVRDSLRAALVAGCDDLIQCVRNPACPLEL